MTHLDITLSLTRTNSCGPNDFIIAPRYWEVLEHNGASKELTLVGFAARQLARSWLSSAAHVTAEIEAWLLRLPSALLPRIFVQMDPDELVRLDFANASLRAMHMSFCEAARYTLHFDAVMRYGCRLRGHFELLSLDAEGFEMEVLLRCNHTECTPELERAETHTFREVYEGGCWVLEDLEPRVSLSLDAPYYPASGPRNGPLCNCRSYNADDVIFAKDFFVGIPGPMLQKIYRREEPVRA